MRIVIRLPNWVGDVVMAIPVVRTVRRAFPEANITVAAKPSLLAIVQDCCSVDARIALPASLLQQAKLLRAGGFDYALILPNSWSSALACWLARIPQRVGYANDGRELLLTESLRVPRLGRLRPQPMPEYYLNLCALLGCKQHPHDALLTLPDSAACRDIARATLEKRGGRLEPQPIAFNVGAGFGPSKHWPVASWAELAARLGGAGRSIVVYGGPKDRAIVEAVVESCTGVHVVGLTDVPLGELAAHMRHMAMLISTDAGGRHFGVAVGIPTVVLMGPNHPNYTEAANDNYVVLLTKPPCWPCHLRTCPIDHRCMRDLSPDLVGEIAERWLAGQHPYGGQRPWVTEPGAEHRLFTGAAC